MKKTIGIIGGVSWESTVLYCQLINQTVSKKFGGLNTAKIIINSLNYAPIVQYGVSLSGARPMRLQQNGVDYEL